MPAGRRRVVVALALPALFALSACADDDGATVRDAPAPSDGDSDSGPASG